MKSKTAGVIALTGGALILGSILHRRNVQPTPMAGEPLTAHQPTPPPEPPPVTLAAAPRNPAQRELIAHFNSGNYGKALELARQYRQDYAGDEAFISWLNKQQPVLLTAQGWYQLKTGHCEEAIALFSQALAMQELPETWKGLGVCYRKNNAVLEAEQALEQALKYQPNDLETSWLLIDVLESQQRFEDIVARIETLRQKNLIPEEQRERWEKRSQSMAAKAQESPLQAAISSMHAAIRFRAGDFDQVAQTTLETIEEALAEWQNEYRWDLSAFHVEVLLYPSNQFPSLVSESPAWAQGLFDGRIRIPIVNDFLTTDNSDTLRRIVRHETLHAVLTTLVDQRPLPPWFQEGVAQYLECPQGCSRFQFPPAPGNFVDATLFSQTFQKHSRTKARMMYLQSWYLILVLQYKLTHLQSNPLQVVFSNLNASSPVDSDGILKPLPISFTSLHQFSRELWEKQISF